MTNPDTASHVARQNMVASQVRTNKVWDMAIVDAMETIPRKPLFPKAMSVLPIWMRISTSVVAGL